ncbi:MAG: hypothetical protein WCC93_10925, partial [Chthoniobacterales bacterium]
SERDRAETSASPSGVAGFVSTRIAVAGSFSGLDHRGISDQRFIEPGRLAAHCDSDLRDRTVGLCYTTRECSTRIFRWSFFICLGNKGARVPAFLLSSSAAGGDSVHCLQSRTLAGDVLALPGRSFCCRRSGPCIAAQTFLARLAGCLLRRCNVRPAQHWL